MEITIYILDGGHWPGQFSFKKWDNDNQHSFEVSVPDGSSLNDDQTILHTPDGARLTASMVVTYGRLAVDGFSNEVPHNLSAWHS